MNQLPAHLANRQRRDLASSAMAGLNAGSPPHVSIAGNRFTLVDAAGNERQIQTLFLDVCIIDANATVSKIFYDPRTKYDPSGDNNNPPLCFSDNGIGASAQAAQPQNTSCQLCPHNAWGSAVSQMTGKQTKACNDAKKLAVMVPGLYDQVFLLRVPPASLKHLAKYTQTLLGHGVDLPDAVTRLEFESQGVLKFTPVGYVDEPTAAATDKLMEAKATDLLLGKSDRPWNGAADAQKLAYAQQQNGAALPPPVQQQAPQPAPMAPPPQPFGGAPAPAQPFDPYAQMAGAAPSAPFSQRPVGKEPALSAPFGATSSPTPGPAAEPPKQRKPRAPKAPAAVAPQDDGIPPFLQRNAEPAPATVEPPANQFGMVQNAPAPDVGMAAALDAAFRLPT